MCESDKAAAQQRKEVRRACRVSGEQCSERVCSQVCLRVRSLRCLNKSNLASSVQRNKRRNSRRWQPQDKGREMHQHLQKQGSAHASLVLKKDKRSQLTDEILYTEANYVKDIDVCIRVSNVVFGTVSNITAQSGILEASSRDEHCEIRESDLDVWEYGALAFCSQRYLEKAQGKDSSAYP